MDKKASHAALGTILGAEVPSDRAIDGIDQRAYFLGAKPQSNRNHILTFIEDEVAAVRWKHYQRAVRQTQLGRRKMSIEMNFPKTIVLTSILAVGAVISAASLSHAEEANAAFAAVMGDLPDGYVAPEALPDSLLLVPTAPQYGSARKAADEATAAAAIEIQGTARFDLARRDANLHFPEATDAFACALGARITVEDTPRLQQLMARSLVDAGLATYKAKTEYKRKRPFMENGAPICTPEDEEKLRTDGSYPSGHTAVGWAWALILSELAPDRTDALLARGIQFGESRIICNVHWRNDVTTGSLMGASAVALMHANPEFIADMKAAKSELAAAPPLSGVDCAAEAEALKIWSSPLAR